MHQEVVGRQGRQFQDLPKISEAVAEEGCLYHQAHLEELELGKSTA